jgi:hypothetical protein
MLRSSPIYKVYHFESRHEFRNNAARKATALGVAAKSVTPNQPVCGSMQLQMDFARKLRLRRRYSEKAGSHPIC